VPIIVLRRYLKLVYQLLCERQMLDSGPDEPLNLREVRWDLLPLDYPPPWQLQFAPEPQGFGDEMGALAIDLTEVVGAKQPYSALQLLLALAEQTGPCHLLLSTCRVDADSLEAWQTAMEKKVILSAKCALPKDDPRPQLVSPEDVERVFGRDNVLKGPEGRHALLQNEHRSICVQLDRDLVARHAKGRWRRGTAWAMPTS
jgi:hypothetical protein